MPLPEALPDDIREVMGKWQVVVGSAGAPTKNHLRDVTLSLAADNSLMVICKNSLAADYFMDSPLQETHQEEVASLIARVINKEVKLTFVQASEDRPVEEQFVDFGALINMDIEVEN